MRPSERRWRAYDARPQLFTEGIWPFCLLPHATPPLIATDLADQPLEQRDAVQQARDRHRLVGLVGLRELAGAADRGGLTMSLEGGFEEVDESLRAAANCFSSSVIRASAAASFSSSSATRTPNRAHFRHGPRRIFMTRQFTR